MRKCKIEGCEEKHYGRGWCRSHYRRWYHHGDPEAPSRFEDQGCDIEGCDEPHLARGWCSRHYRRWQRTGSPTGSNRKTLAERLWEKTERQGDCLIWTGSQRENGYGQISVDNKPEKAHRVAFYVTHGRWPQPQCNHHCHIKLCVEPDHLYEGTHEDNMQDAVEQQAMGRHPNSLANLEMMR